MADLIPKIVKQAQVHPKVRVECPRPDRMAAELRKHLPNHTITSHLAPWSERRGYVLVEAPASRACSGGPVCARGPT